MLSLFVLLLLPYHARSDWHLTPAIYLQCHKNRALKNDAYYTQIKITIYTWYHFCSEKRTFAASVTGFLTYSLVAFPVSLKWSHSNPSYNPSPVTALQPVISKKNYNCKRQKKRLSNSRQLLLVIFSNSNLLATSSTERAPGRSCLLAIMRSMVDKGSSADLTTFHSSSLASSMRSSSLLSTTNMIASRFWK